MLKLRPLGQSYQRSIISRVPVKFMKRMAWNWWGHGVGVGSWAAAEAELEKRKGGAVRVRKRRIRIGGNCGVGLIGEAEAISSVWFGDGREDTWLAAVYLYIKEQIRP